jgi:hypothetical protein
VLCMYFNLALTCIWVYWITDALLARMLPFKVGIAVRCPAAVTIVARLGRCVVPLGTPAAML